MQHQLMSLNRGERLIKLYQYLPRGEQNAKSIQQLMVQFNPNGEKFASRRKSLEQDLASLYQLLGEQALQRIPDWTEDNISGQTARYYLAMNYVLEPQDEQSQFLWEMLNRFTVHYLPSSIKGQLEQRLPKVQADKHYQNSELGDWKNHLITLPNILNAPTFDSQILATIHQALQKEQVLEFVYQSKWSEQQEFKTLYPVGLVFIDNMVYLTGFYAIGDSPSVSDEQIMKNHRNFAVNRISQASVLPKNLPSWLTNEKFGLSSLQQMGKLERYVDGKPKTITLKLRINKYACDHLRERPLSKDIQSQTLVDELPNSPTNNWKILTATVDNTERLQDWLIAMSQLSEVLEPVWLREVIYQRLRRALGWYEK